jgi:Flp pilus assembly protein TadG
MFFWRENSLRNRLVRRFAKSERGVTAVEFALVGGPFIYLLGVIFETGIMLFTEYAIENGVARAARMIRTGQIQKGSMSAADFKDEVCGSLSAFLDCDAHLKVDVRKFTAFADISIPKPVDNDGKVKVDENFQTGGPMEVVVVRAYYDWKLIMPGISQLSNIAGGRRLLSAGAVFRNEPYS